MKLNNLEEKAYIYNIKKPDGSYFRTNNVLLGKIIYDMKKGYSPLILIVGRQRMGKSHFAVWLSIHVMNFFNTGIFDPKRNTFYDPIDAVRNLDKMKKRPLIIDEAGAYLNAKEWYSKINIAMEKIIISQAYLNCLFIFISPFASSVAKAMRKEFNFVVTMKKRGLAIVRQIPKNYYDLSGVPPKPYFIESMSIKLSDVPKKVWNNYLEYSFEQKEKIRKELINQQKFMKKDPFGRPIRDQYEITEKFGAA